MIFGRKKLTKFPNFTRFLPEKMPEFYITIARKIFFTILFVFFWGGGHVAPSPAPVSYAYAGFQKWRYAFVADCVSIGISLN